MPLDLEAPFAFCISVSRLAGVNPVAICLNDCRNLSVRGPLWFNQDPSEWLPAVVSSGSTGCTGRIRPSRASRRPRQSSLHQSKVYGAEREAFSCCLVFWPPGKSHSRHKAANYEAGGGAGVVAGVAAGAAGAGAGADCAAGGAGVGVAAAGGFEPSQPIKAVTPRERQIICTIFMEMLFKQNRSPSGARL